MRFAETLTFGACQRARITAYVLLAWSVILLSPSLLRAQAYLTGFWVLRVPTGDGNYRETFFDLKQTGETVNGKVLQGTRQMPITDGTFKDGKLHFVLPVSSRGEQRQAAYDGTWDGSQISLTVLFPKQETDNGRRGAFEA